jgi:hypothetical protein
MSILKANRIENLTTTDGGININNSGQVAIGVASASKPLHIYQTADAGIRIQNNTTGTGTTDGILLEATGSDGLFWNYESGNLRFATGNSERLRIDSIGRVGIGTSSPAFGVGSGLEIERAGSATLRIEDSASSSGFEIQNASGSIDFNGYNSQPFTFKHNTTERLRINSSGVTVSSGNLSMHSGGRIFVGNGGNAVNPMFANVSDTNTGIAFPSADTMLLSTGGSERLRIDSSGNVGIGKSSNLFYRLTLAESSGDTGRIGWVSTSGNRKSSIDCANTAAIRFNIGTSDTERMRVTDNGLTFNGDTAAANALDDYEEGAFTPGMKFGGSNTGITYTVAQGFYVKIGKLVHCKGNMTLSNNGSGTGTATVTGLPYNIANNLANTSLEGGGFFTFQTNLSGTTYGPMVLAGEDGDSFAYIYRATNTNGEMTLTTHSTIDNDFDCRFVFTYHAA